MRYIPILVVSCDWYADVWAPFFEIFRKRWPDCPHPVFLGSNHKGYSGHDVETILVGDDISWAENLRRMLDALGSRHVIMMLEDFFLVREVDTARVTDLVKTAIDNEVGCLRLYPHPPPTAALPDRPGIGELRKGDEWRASTQTALWDIDVLRSLAWTGFSAWDFEIIGSLVSYALPNAFWGVYDAAVDYRHVVIRGRWMRSGLSICEAVGVTPDLSARAVLGADESESYDSGRRTLSEHMKSVPARFYARPLRLMRPRHYITRLLRQAGVDTAENLRRLEGLNFSGKASG